MRVLIFGATGMVGQAVLRECLLAPDVELIATVGRPPPERKPQSCAKLCTPISPTTQDWRSN
jgi:uncharacterized protein YbjT (DUF2867 family)